MYICIIYIIYIMQHAILFYLGYIQSGQNFSWLSNLGSILVCLGETTENTGNQILQTRAQPAVHSFWHQNQFYFCLYVFILDHTMQCSVFSPGCVPWESSWQDPENYMLCWILNSEQNLGNYRGCQILNSGQLAGEVSYPLQ